jgi:hypothetical protein
VTAPARALAALLAAAALGGAGAAEPGAVDAGVPGAGAPDAGVPGGADRAVAPDDHVIRVDPRTFQIAPDDSGPVNYYTIVSDPDGDYLRSAYVPELETAVLAWPVPEPLRHSVARVRWRWRALTLPNGGNECESGKNDSAAVVYLTFKRGWNWYSLKYVWSSVGPRGVTCDKRRSLLRWQDTIIAETGGPVGRWHTVEVDPEAEFRRHFDRGHASSERPQFMGIGIMSDGDQTHSPSAADFGGFVVTLR